MIEFSFSIFYFPFQFNQFIFLTSSKSNFSYFKKFNSHYITIKTSYQHFSLFISHPSVKDHQHNHYEVWVKEIIFFEEGCDSYFIYSTLNRRGNRLNIKSRNLHNHNSMQTSPLHTRQLTAERASVQFP